MERVIAADHMLRQEQELGRAKPIMIGQEPPFDMHGDPWVKIDRTGEDPAFNIYLPPDVPHWEAVDTLIYGKLQKLIDKLNVEHVRSPKIGGSRLGYARGRQVHRDQVWRCRRRHHSRARAHSGRALRIGRCRSTARSASCAEAHRTKGQEDRPAGSRL
jgi:hypothetical protein